MPLPRLRGFSDELLLISVFENLLGPSESLQVRSGCGSSVEVGGDREEALAVLVRVLRPPIAGRAFFARQQKAVVRRVQLHDQPSLTTSLTLSIPIEPHGYAHGTG